MVYYMLYHGLSTLEAPPQRSEQARDGLLAPAAEAAVNPVAAPPSLRDSAEGGPYDSSAGCAEGRADELTGDARDWNAVVQAAIDQSEDLQSVRALAPLILRSQVVPGDFIIDGFGDDVAWQILAAGVKLHGYQIFLRDIADKRASPSTLDLVAALLETICQERDDVSVTSHGAGKGNASRTTGPVPFAKQLGVIQKRPPFPQAPPLPVSSATAYYGTLQTTTRLEALLEDVRRQWPDGTPRGFDSGLELLQFQADLATLLARHLVGASEDYVAPQLARKIAHVRAGEPFALDYAGASVSDVRRASADARDFLREFDGSMPAAILQAAFLVPPVHFTMWRCLVGQLSDLKLDAAWVRANELALETCLLKFHEDHGFYPSLGVAAKAVLAGAPRGAPHGDEDAAPRCAPLGDEDADRAGPVLPMKRPAAFARAPRPPSKRTAIGPSSAGGVADGGGSRSRSRSRSRAAAPDAALAAEAAEAVSLRPLGAHELTWTGSVSAAGGTDVRCILCSRSCSHGTNLKKQFGEFLPPKYAKHNVLECLRRPETSTHAKRRLYVVLGTAGATTRDYFRVCSCGSEWCGPEGRATHT